MKKIILLIPALFCFSFFHTFSQINVAKKLKQKVEKKIDQKVDETIDKKVDQVFDGKKEEDTPPPAQNSSAQNNQSPAQSTTAVQQSQKPELIWSKYDFVPGDKVIFEDNQFNEENGEFPSRWDLVTGTTENAVFGGEKVIMFRGGGPCIVPYLSNSNKDYLPAVFTIEFDLYLPGSSFLVYFYDRKNQKYPTSSTSLNISENKMDLSPANSTLPGGENIKNKWAHIAIAYTNGKFKAYINQTRLINIPHLSFEPTGVSLYTYHASDNSMYYVKNFRLAEGGVKYYDRFLQDGKIVSNGIRFDVGKASLRPESMGAINEIYSMMKDHPEIRLSIEGHTDSDGDDETNLKLSEDRAAEVMSTLVGMGIKKDRLSSKGWGESKPVDNNQTAEGKANNRRVEFVKVN